MRKVKNNKAVKRLAVKSFGASRTRNIMAKAAIILTAVLFTAIFTIGLGLIKHAERSSMLQAGGDAHGAIKDLSQKQYDILKKHPLIKECGRDESLYLLVGQRDIFSLPFRIILQNGLCKNV